MAKPSQPASDSTVARFLDSCTRANPDKSELAGNLRHAYGLWCRLHGETAVNSTVFGRTIADRHPEYRKRKAGGVVRYDGIELLCSTLGGPAPFSVPADEVHTVETASFLPAGSDVIGEGGRKLLDVKEPAADVGERVMRFFEEFGKPKSLPSDDQIDDLTELLQRKLSKANHITDRSCLGEAEFRQLRETRRINAHLETLVIGLNRLLSDSKPDRTGRLDP